MIFFKQWRAQRKLKKKIQQTIAICHQIYHNVSGFHLAKQAREDQQLFAYEYIYGEIDFNKTEVKKSVEGIYGVDVLSVNIIRIPAKKRRLGRTEGFRKAYKKAVVTIKEGQKIEIL